MTASSQSFPAGGGITGAEIRARDWSDTALGPPDGWPPALRNTLALMLACPQPMFLAWGPDLLCFYNDPYRPILGYRLATALGRPFREVWGSIWDDIGPLVAATLAGESQTLTDQLLDLAREGRPEQSWWSFTYSPAFDDAGQVAGLFCVTGETTDRVLSGRALEKRVEEALLQRKLWADVFEITDALVAALDTDYRFLAVNRAYADTFETLYSVRPRVGDRLLDLLSPWPRHHAEARAVWSRALGGEEFTIVEMFGEPERGRTWFELKFTALRDAEGQRIGSFQYAQDVTDRLRGEEQLAQAEAALRQAQKMEAVGQLTGGIAHDFNNLLAGISGSLELMGRRIGQGRVGEVDRYMNAAQGAARRAASLTHRLLAFSRRQTLDPKPTAVNRLVAGMEDLIRRSIGPGIALAVEGDSDLWPALVDPPQLENALLNLCINARDAMPDGGRITVATANTVLDESDARSIDLEPGAYLRLCVSDTGTGMTPDIAAKAFDPFFTTKPMGEGTGLGLSMIYGFVRQSGGQVRIESAVGEGTSVCLFLPRHDGEVSHDDEAGPAGQPARAKPTETVLVVDDEPTVRMLVVEVLEDLGYAAIEAADGPAGLAILRSDARIDLLVSDIGLPGGMNGRQMAEAARVNRPELKVLFITGYAETAVIGNGLGDPGMAVLTKPFGVEALAARIRAMIGRDGRAGTANG